jgi:hypothetical protein
MLVEVGHSTPENGATVTQVSILDDTNEDGSYLSNYQIGTDALKVKAHLFDNPGIVTRLPGNTVILDIVRPIRTLVKSRIMWVSVDPEGRDVAVGEDLERFLSEFYQCQKGAPTDVEDTHWTLHNGISFAPGNSPKVEA